MSREQLGEVLGFPVSDEQWAVVSAPLSPAVVVAGAGSGKTTSMAARVAYLVGSGQVRADRVLGLTFTNKAAAELLARMRAQLARARELGFAEEPEPDALAEGAGEPAGDPLVATYNAFAARIVHEHGLRLGREPGARMLADGARHELAYRIACRTPLDLGELGVAPASVTADLLALDDELSNLDLEPEALIAHETAAIAELDASGIVQKEALRIRAAHAKRRLLAQLVVSWREEKHSRDLLDFADQTRLALALVRAFPEVAAAVRASYDVVLLDEYQDTAIAQRRLMQVLFGDGHPVTAVGDPCQAIYGWRGASVDNIESFTEHFSYECDGGLITPARFALRTNRRSGPVLLEVANEVSSPLRARHIGVERLEPDPGKSGGLVRAGLFATSAEERRWIADDIAEAARGMARREIAVLASTTAELAAIERELRERGVPTQRHGAAGLLDQPAVVELRSVLEVLHSPMANPAMVRLLTGARWRIGARDLAALGRRASHLAGGGHRAQTADVAEALEEAVRGADPAESVSLVDAVLDPGDAAAYSPEAFARMGALAEEILMLRRHAGEPVPELIARVLDVTGLGIELAVHGVASSQRIAMGTFADLATDFTSLEGSVTLGAFLSRLREAERFDVDLPLAIEGREDAVQLLTVFKAKGLEYDRVYVAGIARGAFPGGRSRGSWLTDATMVPWPLRPDASDDLRAWPHPEGPRDKHVKAYRAVLGELEAAEAERLLYVALTRARHALTVTGHWWGPTQTTLRGPEPHLAAVRTACEGAADGTVLVTWAEPPEEGAENPSPTAGATVAAWPAHVASASAWEVIATQVRARIDAAATLPGMPADAPTVSEGQRAPIARWDDDLAVLLEEERDRRSPHRVVRLPESVSASLLVRAARDPEAVARELARPMPAAPAPAARRGTAFHLWVEQRYGQLSLIDPDDVPGAADDLGIRSDEALQELKRAFERSPYAERTPVAVEEPFALLVDGRVVRGRIDAVFADGEGGFEVVDWKTGSAAGTDPYQLALYRAAWAQIADVDPNRVRAAFVLVATGEVIVPADLPEPSGLLRT